MERVFEEALTKRRNHEFTLTSTMTNISYYGSPANANKKDIWPPLSTALAGQITGPKRPAETLVSSAHASLPRSPIESAKRISDHGPLYQPLHHGSLIRVLEILPGNSVDPILCHFHLVDLQASPLKRYEALSYVWGTGPLQNINNMRKEPIQCNSHKLIISSNLEQAIKHTRSRSAPVFLWADAICINQEDQRERGHQVSLMSEIYRKAERVLIWLGTTEGLSFRARESRPEEFEDARAQRAFGAVCEVVNDWKRQANAAEDASYEFHDRDAGGVTGRFSHFEEFPSSVASSDDQQTLVHALQAYYPPYITTQGKNPFRRDDDQVQAFDLAALNAKMTDRRFGLDADEDSVKYSPLWSSLKDLFSCSWFWRVWVVQECILASSAIVKWGHAAIDWRWIGLASAILRTNYHKICEKSKISGVYNAYLIFRMSPMSDLPPLQLSFIQLLRLTRQFEVTDKRDRVYGLLGIETTDNSTDGGKLFINPDYSISDSELWKRLARKVIHDSGSLSLLSSVQYSTESFEGTETGTQGYFFSFRQRLPDEILPSWVPHWEIVYRATLAPWDVDEQFSAAKRFPLNLQPNTYSDSLVVEGIEVGLVGFGLSYMWHGIDISALKLPTLGPFFKSESGLRLLARTLTAGRNWYGSLVKHSNEALADFSAHLLETFKKKLLPRESYTSFSRDDSCHEPYEWGLPYESESEEILEAYSQAVPMLEELTKNGNAARFRETAIPVCERRRIFLTVNGLLGMGPDCVQEGDIVAVLSGGDLPFILRPVKPDTETALDIYNPPKKYYRLVGECYIEGLMQGEVTQALKEGQDFVGPVPPGLVLQEIVTKANTPEPFEETDFKTVGEIERLRRKKEMLEQGRLARKEDIEHATSVRLEKRWFDIR